ncbi:MAG: ABC transporter substrate-binding protein [Slackia sp.]|nr:ABC transporter substrate-binding protein [Slackia sp.]
MRQPSFSRRRFSQLLAVGASSAAFAGVLSSCAQSESSDSAPADEAAQEKTQVIVSMPPNAEPEAGFDPFVAWGCGEHVHEPLIQSTLIKTDADMGLHNDLATSYECSDDGMVWTFKIRTDAKFTDGEALTAEDVAFTINGIKEAPSSEADFSMVSEAVALDDETVEIRMAHPFNILMYTLATVGICPAHAHGADYGSNPIGSGRYKLAQWDRGQQIIFEANPDYYGEPPAMQRVVIVFMDEDASLAAAQSGQVDVAYTSAALADAAPAGFELLSVKTVDSRGISLPVVPAGAKRTVGDVEYAAGNDITCDLALRRAMNHAVDREFLVKRSLGGHATPAFSPSDGMPWACEDMKIATDVEKAKAILEEGGWKPGDDGVLAKDGTRAEFSLYYMTNDMMRQAMAADFAEQMAPLGIKVNVEGKAWEDLEPLSYCEAQLWGWGSNSPIEIYNLNYSEGTSDFACRDSETTNAYLEQAVSTPTIEESYELYRKAQFDGEEGVTPDTDAPWVWLANADHLYFTREGLKVAEQKPHPHGHGWSIVNNVDEWSWM